MQWELQHPEIILLYKYKQLLSTALHSTPVVPTKSDIHFFEEATINHYTHNTMNDVKYNVFCKKNEFNQRAEERSWGSSSLKDYTSAVQTAFLKPIMGEQNTK